MTALRAGLAYAAVMFAIGFVLGTFRILIVVPRLGPLAAALMELPVMLALSWLICGRLIARFGVPVRPDVRLVMGAAAFAALMAFEWIMGMTLFRESGAQILASYGTAAGAIGLAGQLAFAAMPLAQGIAHKRSRR